MPNLKITVGVHSFVIEGAHDLVLPAEIVDLAHQWLEAVSDTAAEAQHAIDAATATLKGQSDALQVVVDAQPAP